MVYYGGMRAGQARKKAGTAFFQRTEQPGGENPFSCRGLLLVAVGGTLRGMSCLSGSGSGSDVAVGVSGAAGGEE